MMLKMNCHFSTYVVLLVLATCIHETNCKSWTTSEQWMERRPAQNDKKHVGDDPELMMNATQLITSKGFPCENHYVTTDDGYILNVIRIPHGRNNSKIKGPRPVVFLQHGFCGSCTDFLLNPANESLAYILADAGADVWLGNSRGNFYSINHTTIHTKSNQFWRFSWDEMAKYDLPASINYTMAKTGVDQIYYVGHSQGTSIAFAAFQENPELASHIKHFIALAPVAQLANTQSPLRYIAPLAKSENMFYDLFGHGSFGMSPSLARLLAEDLCKSYGEYLCISFMFLFSGFDFQSLNVSRVPIYQSHKYEGMTSTGDVLHWAQAINSKKFQHFDYGSADENMQHYGQKTPPLYEPKNMKVPVAAFYGGKDWLADPHDVSWLLPQLNVTNKIYVPHYDHMDFIFGTDAPNLIYKSLLNIICF